MGRKILAVVAGFVVAFLAIFLFEGLNGRFFPLPSGVDPQNPAALAAAVKSMPLGAFVVLIAGYAVASFAGGFAAGKVAPGASPVPAVIVGVLLLAGGIWNFVTIPHPLWVVVLSVLCYLPCAFLGSRLAAGGAATVPAS
jgi:hypothetical protein